MKFLKSLINIVKKEKKVIPKVVDPQVLHSQTQNDSTYVKEDFTKVLPMMDSSIKSLRTRWTDTQISDLIISILEKKPSKEILIEQKRTGNAIYKRANKIASILKRADVNDMNDFWEIYISKYNPKLEMKNRFIDCEVHELLLAIMYAKEPLGENDSLNTIRLLGNRGGEKELLAMNTSPPLPPVSGEDLEKQIKVEQFNENLATEKPDTAKPNTAKQFDTDKRSKLEEYDENMETLRLKMEDLIKEISEELMLGKLPNLAKEEAATNILAYYTKKIRGHENDNK